MTQIRVFVADDHPLTRRGIASDFQAAGDIQVVGEAATLSDTLEHCMDNHPHILVVDLNMDKALGSAVVTHVKARYPDAKIVVLSMLENISTIEDAYKAGAMAYVLKTRDDSSLVDAVRTVFMGKVYFMPGMAEEIALHQMRADTSAKDPRKVLSSSELEIFLLCANGVDPAAIAKQTGKKDKTVINRIYIIQKKLNVKHHHFDRLAVQYGLIQPQEHLQ